MKYTDYRGKKPALTGYGPMYLTQADEDRARKRLDRWCEAKIFFKPTETFFPIIREERDRAKAPQWMYRSLPVLHRHPPKQS